MTFSEDDNLRIKLSGDFIGELKRQNFPFELL